ncbi:MAG: polysialyltransferase family glycosyltransferase [Bacilli bacterium]
MFVVFLVFSIVSCDNGQVIHPKKEVNIMATLGTLPTLYAGLIALDSPLTTYMWYSRGDTFSGTESMPDKIKLSKNIGSDFSVKIQDEFVDIIHEELSKNPNVFFNLFCDDLRVQFAITVMDKAGLDENQYSVTLLSDGTGSYDLFSSRYYSSETGFTNYLEDYNSWLDAKSNPSGVSVSATTQLKNSMYPFATKYKKDQHEYNYFLQWPEALQSQNTDIELIMQESLLHKNGIVKMTPQTLFDNLSESNKLLFQSMVGLGGESKVEYDGYFKSEKPALIISGTSIGGEGSKDDFERVVNEILGDYNSYNVFFKPHPRFDPNNPSDAEYDYLTDKKDFLETNEITILKAMMPMESLLFIYSDVKIGGYSSSLYMSAKKEQLEFFIVNNIDELSDPLPFLYAQGLFGAVKTYDKTK